ncbi:MAG: hypothetical protein NT005_04565 [Spirochaetes bacterium]|nr:hypothetical protein [Spirochaetota bacterium]
MTALLLAAFLLLLPSAARAQDAAAPAEAAPIESQAPESQAPESPAQPDAEASHAAEVSSAQLASSTLAEDIATAGYYELVAWCRELGIDDAGGRAELQQKVALALKVELPAKPAVGKKSISVRSARESEYFTLTEIGEKYVTLTGDVVVEVRDESSGALHAISASRILYNQTLGIVTAEGAVSYTLTRGGKTELFEGESLSFDLETSEAVFYNGQSSKTANRAGTDLTYFFRGETISRLANDTVVLSSGSFTSCDASGDPHYQIRARRVWILAPGEWAIQSAVLLVGRVPLLYLPVFFWPGDRMLFNPAIGYRVREGTYLQTTTYLIGRREKEPDNPLSFLKLTEADTANYGLELHGIFLKKIPATAPAAEKEGSLKLMLDAYSRLGAFAGIAGDFPPLASFKAGVGVSRSLFSIPLTNTASGNWTQFWIEPDGTAVSKWNSSSLFGLPVPFRFGMEGNLNKSDASYSVSARIEYFSDPVFTRDFYSRTEGLALTDVLANAPAASQAVAEKRTLSWDLASRADLSRLLKLPTSMILSVPSLNMKVEWQSKDANPAPASTQPEYWDPGKTFYFPYNITAPDASLSLTGDLLKLDTAGKPSLPASGGQPAGAPQPGEPSADPGKGVRMPVPPAREAEQPTAGLPKSAHLTLRDPSRKPDLPVTTTAPQSSFTISYQVQPRARLEHRFDTLDWATKEDVDNSILYRTLETGGSSRLSGTAVIVDRLAEVTAGLSADGNYRVRFDPPAVAPIDWQGLVLSDYQQDRFELRTSLGTTVRPFLAVPALAGSSLAYKLGWRVYQLKFTGTVPVPVFTPSVLTWDKETVPEHSLQSSFQLAALGQTDTLTLSCQLPPLDFNLAGQLAFGLGDWKTRVQGGVREVSGSIQAQPLIASESVLLGGKLTASEELQFLTDPLAPSLDRSVTQVSGWGGSASLTAQRMIPVDPLGTPDPGSVKEFLPSSIRLAYASQAEPQWLWKDRVRLDGAIATSWNLNLQRYTDNLFDFSLKLNAVVSEFLELSVSSLSTNTRTYRYIPGWREAVEGPGAPWVNPFADLLASFNFANRKDREDSQFKIRTIAIKAVHHLHDWDLSFEYQGSPQLSTPTSGPRQYVWTPTFTLLVQWVPVQEVKSRIGQDATGLLSMRG